MKFTNTSGKNIVNHAPWLIVAEPSDQEAVRYLVEIYRAEGCLEQHLITEEEFWRLRSLQCLATGVSPILQTAA